MISATKGGVRLFVAPEVAQCTMSDSPLEQLAMTASLDSPPPVARTSVAPNRTRRSSAQTRLAMRSLTASGPDPAPAVAAPLVSIGADLGAAPLVHSLASASPSGAAWASPHATRRSSGSSSNVGAGARQRGRSLWGGGVPPRSGGQHNKRIRVADDDVHISTPFASQASEGILSCSGTFLPSSMSTTQSQSIESWPSSSSSAASSSLSSSLSRHAFDDGLLAARMRGVSGDDSYDCDVVDDDEEVDAHVGRHSGGVPPLVRSVSAPPARAHEIRPLSNSSCVTCGGCIDIRPATDRPQSNGCNCGDVSDGRPATASSSCFMESGDGDCRRSNPPAATSTSPAPSPPPQSIAPATATVSPPPPPNMSHTPASLLLPTVPLNDCLHKDLATISGETLRQLLDGQFADRIGSTIVLDCRFPYEFEGEDV